MKSRRQIKVLIANLSCAIFLFIAMPGLAQTPSVGVFFQAVAKDNFSNPAKDRKIYVQSSILQTSATGTAVLTEVHETTTDATGVFGISIGQGTRTGGIASSLATIAWANGPFYLSLKIAISPNAPIPNWDYTKDWIDLGTTPFGTVPYALYSVTTGALDTKLNITDTSKMLALYAKAQTVQSLSTAVATKIATTDTAAMLAPYKKVVNDLVASNITSLTAAAINAGLDAKVNLADSATVYITPAQLKAKTFDSTSIYNNLALKELSSNKSTSVAADASSDTKYPSVKSVKNYVDAQVSAATIADADVNTKGKLQLAGDLTGTAAAPTVANNAITTAKVNNAAITTAKIADANVTDAKIVSVSGSKITGNISGNAATATKIVTPVTINGVAFDGSSNITIASTATNALTMNNSGAGEISGAVYDGSASKTISYNTIGASPLAGSSSLTTLGTISTGTWNGSTIAVANGGTGATDAINARANLGLIIGTDVLGYRTFGSAANNNTADFEPAINAGTNNEYYRGDKSWQTLNTTVVPEGSNLYYTTTRANTDFDSRLGTKSTTNITEGSNLYYTTTRAHADFDTRFTTKTTADLTEGSNLYFTNARVKSALSLTTTGNSGAATYSSTTGIFNIPEYTLSGLGYDLNGLTSGIQTFAVGTSGTDFGITSASGVHTFSIPSASASNRGLLTSVDWSTFNNKANNTAFTSSSSGLVPNPSAASGRFLKDDGTWSTIPAQVSADWNASSGVASILNKPDLSLKENAANKSTATDLGDASPSDILFPTQKAVKSYIDVSVSNAVSSGAPDATTSAPGKVKLAGDLSGTATLPVVALVGGSVASNIHTAELLANAATTNNTASTIVKRDASGNFTAGTITANLAGNVTGTLNGNATNVTGTVAVGNGGTGATSLTGYVKGNGTSAMTASSSIPVADITGAETTTNKSTVTDLGGNSANDTKYPSQLAVKTYVDTKVAAATIADADASTKGKIQLTGDLSGTAASPSVATVGGSTASEINAATVLANAATASNTANAIIKRDANGDFVARNITGNLFGNATNVTGIVLGANGGTGVDNTGKTITLGGNLVTSGNYNATFTLGANTNISLPSSGTIASLAGSEAFTNKTINGLTPTALTTGFSISGGTSTSTTLTVGNNASVAGTNTGDQTISLTGDVVGSGTGTFSTTLSNTGVVANTYGSATTIPSFTVDAKGRITGVTNTAITGAGSTLSNGTILLGNGSNQAAEVQLSGDLTMDNTGATSIGASKVTNTMLAGNIDLTNKVTGSLPVANGGTGANTLTGYLKGHGTNAFTSVSSIPVADVNGAVRSVNGTTADANGAVTISFGMVTTGLLSAKPANGAGSSNNGDIYVVSGDTTNASANNGRTFIYDGTVWNETSTNQAQLDNRYVRLAGNTMDGNLVFPTGKKITIADAPSASLDVANKEYVDNSITTATPSATSSVTGKVQLAGDFGGTATAPTVVTVGGSTASNINAATVLANAATNANTASAIVKRDASGNFTAGTISANLTGNVTGNLTGNVTGNATNVTGTVAVANGGSGATSLTGYVKGNGTSAFSASAAIPVADITGAEAVANKATATDLGASGANDTKYPTQLAVKTYVDTKVAAATIADADATTKGKIQLAGDLGGTAATPTVVTVGGSSASSLHAAELLANAATNANTASTIVRRDASGNFTAGTITATLSGNATNVSGIVLGANGGTGIANTGKTITLGGNLTTSGAYNTTLTTTANTTVTLPSTGTLATLTGSEAFTNKTINGLTPTAQTTGFTIAGGTSTSTTLTVGNNASIAGTNTGDQTITLTGDVTGTGTGTFTSTLANSGVTAGTYGNATTIPAFSVDAKGRITGVTNTTVLGVSPIGSALSSANLIVGNSTNIAAAVAVTGDVTFSNTGVTSIGASKVTNAMLAGSIDLTNKVTGILPLANGGTGLSSLGTSGQVLSSNGTSVVWSNPAATGITAINGITSGTQTLTVGTSGTAPNFSSSSSTHTLNIPMASTTSVTAGLLSKSDYDIFNAKQVALTAGSGISIAAGTISATGLNSSNLASTAGILNTQLAGSITASKLVGTDISTVGTITAGTWSGTAIASNNIATALTGKTYNGITPTAQTTGFTMAGGTTPKTLTVSNDATVSGTNTGDQTITLTGDVTGAGTGTFTTTLANSGVTAGSYGNATTVPAITVDAKGRITSVTATTITASSPIGTPLTSGNIIVGNASNLAASVPMSGDVTISNTGAATISSTIAGNKTFSGSNTFSGATTTVSGNLTGGNTATSTLAGFAANINVQTGTTYTLASTDNGKIITMNNASAITLTVPSGLIVGFNCMIVQLGAGQVTLAGSGATITNRSSFTKTGGTNAITTLISVATNTFISSGDMSN